ncbi:MAG: acyl--CoA ligase [Deltaproteobacteria bacterium]|nr:acyl--CoA ligase [Deltaproteobacteria bacterium]
MTQAAGLILDRMDTGTGAVIAGGRRTAAAEIRARALGLGGWFTQRGVRPGDRVLLLVPPGPELAAALLGLVWAGAVPVLLEPGQAAGAWLARVAAVAPRFAVVDPRLRWVWSVPGAVSLAQRRWPGLPPRPPVELITLPRRVRGEAQAVPRDDTDEALILFTSGTTSAPRAVLHTHGSLPHFLGNVAAAVDGLAVGSYLAETPQQIFYALLLGSTCHVVSGQGEVRLRRTLEVLRSGQVEAWFGSPWTWVRWLEGGWPVPPGLRTVLLGSAPVSRPFLRRLIGAVPAQTAVRGVYGLTEAGPVTLFDGAEKAARDGEGDWVGYPLPGVALHLDQQQVMVSTKALASGYLGETPLGDWLRTGDLGRYSDAEGLTLIGRAKDMMIRRGINLYPGVLEPLLHELVEDAALVGVYDGQREDERVVLAVVGEPPAGLDALLGDAAPDHVLRLDALPRAGRQNKVDKEALRAAARARFGIPE